MYHLYMTPHTVQTPPSSPILITAAANVMFLYIPDQIAVSCASVLASYTSICIHTILMTIMTAYFYIATNYLLFEHSLIPPTPTPRLVFPLAGEIQAFTPRVKLALHMYLLHVIVTRYAISDQATQTNITIFPIVTSHCRLT